MAINLSGLLGGLGIGAQQLASQLEERRKFNINKALAEDEFVQRKLKQQQDYDLARDAAERADKTLLRQERAQALTLANNTDIAVRGLIASDLADEQKTIGDLGSLGLTPERIQQIKDERSARRKLVEDALSAYGKEGIYREVYGDPLMRLAPSRVVAPTYVAPINITPEQRINIFGGARTAIERSAPGQKLQEWGGQVRKLQALGLQPQDIERYLPKPGTVYEAGKITSAERAAMPGEFIQPQGPARDSGYITGTPIVSPKFTPSETLPTGERITREVLPSGQIKVTRQQPDITEQYASAEMEGLKATAQRLQNEQYALLMDPTVKQKILQNEGLQIKNRLGLRQLAWYDRLQSAKIKDLLEQRGSGGSAKAAKDAVNGLMSVSDAVKVYNAEQLNAYRNADLWIKDRAAREAELNRLQSRVDQLKKNANEAEIKGAQSKDTAFEATRKTSIALANNLRKEAADLERQINAIRAGNQQAMARYAGVSSFDPNQASASDLLGYIQNPGGNRLTQMMGGGVAATRSGQSGGAGGIVFSPNFSFGGPGGAGAGPGQGAPGQGGPGGGQSPLGPGGPQPDDLNVKVTTKTLADWKKVFPLLPEAKISSYMDKNRNISEPARAILRQLNADAKKEADSSPKESTATGPNGESIVMLEYPDGRKVAAPPGYQRRSTSSQSPTPSTKTNRTTRKPYLVKE